VNVHGSILRAARNDFLKRKVSWAPLPRLHLIGDTMLHVNAYREQTFERFQFGENWTRFLSVVNEARIAEATARLSELLGDINGKSFLDVGSGSGIHSLAAIRLGASRVLSFDYDTKSVACTAELKRRFAPNANWQIQPGSVLDEQYLRSLGKFDIVYAWGVLHHTGAMWKSFDLITIPVAHTLMVAVYHDEGRKSRLWLILKKLYSKSPLPLKKLLELFTFMLTWGKAFIFKPRKAMRNWSTYSRKRGMSAWRDVVDWAGGYPCEFANAGEVFTFFRMRGFTLETLRTVNGLGLNEFVLSTTESTQPTT
jgi:2-polyprenyl-6-hydroxyphenyl methylase/3-demethylubiquinone-9 3-methyltransferase